MQKALRDKADQANAALLSAEPLGESAPVGSDGDECELSEGEEEDHGNDPK